MMCVCVTLVTGVGRLEGQACEGSGALLVLAVVAMLALNQMLPVVMEAVR